MERPTWGLDLDGVVYNIIDPFDAFVLSRDIPIIDKTSFELGKRYNITEKEGWGLLQHFINKRRAFQTLPLYPDAKKAIKKLNQSGDLYVITARTFSEKAKQDTYDRLQEECGIIQGQILIESNKGYWAEKLGITHFFEDSLDNAHDIIKQSNSKVHLINQTYNQTPDTSRLTRHNSLAEATDFAINKYTE